MSRFPLAVVDRHGYVWPVSDSQTLDDEIESSGSRYIYDEADLKRCRTKMKKVESDKKTAVRSTSRQEADRIVAEEQAVSDQPSLDSLKDNALAALGITE